MNKTTRDNLIVTTAISLDYEEKQQAIDSIEDGKERAGCIVKYIELFDLRRKL